MRKNYKPKGEVNWGTEALLSNPALTAQIAVIANMATAVDGGWGMILADMLQADAELGLNIYLGFKTAFPKERLLETVAEMLDDPALLGRFKELWGASRKAMALRDRVVHGWWATDPKQPTILLRCDDHWFPKTIAARNNDLYRRGHLHLGSSRPLTFDAYNLNDFKQIQTALTCVIERQGDLTTDLLNYGMTRRLGVTLPGAPKYIQSLEDKD